MRADSNTEGQRKTPALIREEDVLAQRTASCWAFGTEDGRDANAAKHNAEVARIINVLGASGSGRRAILTAVAGRQGITDENDIMNCSKAPQS